jgi:hypothetical protein
MDDQVTNVKVSAPVDVNTAEFAELLSDVGFFVVEGDIEAHLFQLRNLLVRARCSDDTKAFLLSELADEPMAAFSFCDGDRTELLTGPRRPKLS